MPYLFNDLSDKMKYRIYLKKNVNSVHLYHITCLVSCTYFDRLRHGEQIDVSDKSKTYRSINFRIVVIISIININNCSMSRAIDRFRNSKNISSPITTARVKVAYVNVP